MQMSNEAKNAILNIFAHAAWAVANGQQYYDALADAFFGVASISAVYTQGGTVYETDALDDLKADLVVTATLKDSTTQTVPSTDYTLSGTLAVGTSTITVSYGGKTTTFDVVVEQKITIDNLIIGVVQDYTVSGDVKKIFYNSASSKRACTNPAMFNAYNGKRYKFSINSSSTYLMAVYAVTGLTFNPQIYDYSIVQGTDEDFYQGVQGTDYNYTLLNGAWSSSDYTYDCANDNEVLFVSFKTSSNATITNSTLTAIKNVFSVEVVE